MEARRDVTEQTRWRRNRRKAIQIAVAVLVGFVLFFVLSFAIGSLPGGGVLAYLAVFSVSYGIVGAVFGMAWPDFGWRSGLWSGPSWFLMYAFGLVLAAEQIKNWPEEVFGLIAVAVLSLSGPCVGGWMGSIIGTRMRANMQEPR